MIRYALACEAGHRFESWFRDSATFDRQSRDGLASCPMCGSSRVEKTIMAPALAGARKRLDSGATEPEQKSDVALLDPRQTEIRSMMRALRDKIVAETRDVGSKFPDEARRMHDGDIPSERIRGQASLEEARALLSDGIVVVPLPMMPEEVN